MQFQNIIKLAVIYSSFFLFACSGGGESEKISKATLTKVSEWKQTKMTMVDKSGETKEKDLSPMEMVWTFAEDGKMTISMKGKTIHEGTWEMKDQIQKSDEGIDYKFMDVKYGNQHERIQVREITDNTMEMVKIFGPDPMQYPTISFVAK